MPLFDLWIHVGLVGRSLLLSHTLVNNSLHFEHRTKRSGLLPWGSVQPVPGHLRKSIHGNVQLLVSCIILYYTQKDQFTRRKVLRYSFFFTHLYCTCMFICLTTFYFLLLNTSVFSLDVEIEIVTFEICNVKWWQCKQRKTMYANIGRSFSLGDQCRLC